MAIASVEEVIVAGLEQTFPAKMGLEKLVFKNAISMTYPTKLVNVDMYDGTRGTAGYTARGAKGQTLGKEGWRTESYQPPVIDENFNIDEEDMAIRNYGEGNIITEARNEEKFQKIVNRQVARTSNRRQRAFNAQIRDLITTGKIVVTEYDDKGVALPSRTIDFKMPAGHIYTVGTAWNASADILGDMKAIDTLIIKASGITPEYAIVGETTLADMIADTKIQSLLDNRRINFGELIKTDRGDGLTSYGMLDGKEIFTFTDFDDAGNPIIPASAYIPGSSMAELDIMFGSLSEIVDGRPTIVETEMLLYTDVDKKAVTVNYGSKTAKLYCLTQSGAFGHITTR
jgi:hypothetical protein